MHSDAEVQSAVFCTSESEYLLVKKIGIIKKDICYKCLLAYIAQDKITEFARIILLL